MLALVSGRYPAGPGQVAVTPSLASTLNLKVGDQWRQGGQTRLVTGIVQNPQSLLDEFALVAPGQVAAPSQVTVLFDAPYSLNPHALGPNVQTRQSSLASNPLNPETIVLALATVGMLLIALVAVGGFTVLAQRRLRALGMLGALGATDRNIRLVVRANGVLVGLAGALIGAVLGLAAWLAYRPRLESSAHHLIGVFQLPWIVIGPAIALAVVATYFAAARPARAITRIPVVAALSGRPAPPKQVHRSALPGVVLLRGRRGPALVHRQEQRQRRAAPRSRSSAASSSSSWRSSCWRRSAWRSWPGRAARPDRDPPGAARPGPLPGQVGLGPRRHQPRRADRRPGLHPGRAAVRQRPGLRRPEPGLQPGRRVHGRPGPRARTAVARAAARPRRGRPPPLQAQAATAHGIAAALGSHDVTELDQAGASLQHAAAGRSWSGPVYVATPQLLAAFGIKAADVSPSADILTMRPGLSGLSKMQLLYGGNGQGGGHGPQDVGANAFPCPPGQCLANPVIQDNALPSGTSAPNTVITEHAIHALGLTTNVAGWLIQAPHPPTAAQITDARLTAAAAGMTIETKSSAPASAEILNYATVFGIVLALGILAMSIGLIRSETASDLRTLTATGASGLTRRELTAATAFSLGLGGAVLGTVAAYVAAIGYSWANPLDGLSGLSSVPVWNLLLLVVGMPVVAAVIGGLMAGREPPALARQPLE